jgi:hypothetical protein
MFRQKSASSRIIDEVSNLPLLIEAIRFPHLTENHIKSLLSNGEAKMGDEDKDGNTALIETVKYGSPKVVGWLFGCGAESTIDHVNKKGESALSIATEKLEYYKARVEQLDAEPKDKKDSNQASLKIMKECVENYSTIIKLINEKIELRKTDVSSILLFKSGASYILQSSHLVNKVFEYASLKR